ncbi:MAG: DUF4112 domain-containing protein [Candidatus Melainabacteria bacterium]|nr:DUF4112 domain-containing protein [Candidatus Melainabacteria bacterium]
MLYTSQITMPLLEPLRFGAKPLPSKPQEEDPNPQEVTSRGARQQRQVDEFKRELQSALPGKPSVAGSTIADLVDVGIGAFPVAGDLAGVALTVLLLIKHKAYHARFIPWLAAIVLSTGIDLAAGVLPIAGDVADAYPSNLINAVLIRGAAADARKRAENAELDRKK